MIKIAICDDDIGSVMQLEEMISRYTPQISDHFNVETFLSGLELLKDYHNYDIIFLDIDMPVMNGIQAAKKIRENDVESKIIYITNHKNYMQQAFSVRSFGYIVKPFSFQDICIELNEVIRILNIQKTINMVDFGVNKTTLMLNPNEIFYFEYKSKNNIEIITKSELFYIHSTLQEVFHKVQGFGFDYPHKSFIVNLLYVKSMKGFNIQMANGDTLPIAQKRTIAFREAHNDFLHKYINVLRQERIYET